MRCRCWLLLILLLMGLSSGCQRDQNNEPGEAAGPSGATHPEWADRLQLSIVEPNLNAASSDRDGRVLLVPGANAVSLVLNTAGKLSEVALDLGDAPLLASALSADGLWLATVSANALQVYSVSDGALRSNVSWLQAVTAARVQISQDGQSVACLRNGYLHLYHGPDLSLRWSSELPASQQAQGLQMSANGLTIAVYGDEAIVYAPDAASPLWRKPLPGECQMAMLSDDGVYLAVNMAVSGGEQQLMLFARWQASPAWEFTHQGAATCLRFSPDSEWLALSADHFYLFDCRNAQPVIQLEQHGSATLAEQQVLLISEQTLYRFQTSSHQVVSWRLPDLPVDELNYVYTQTEWLFALDRTGQVHLIRLPLASATPSF